MLGRQKARGRRRALGLHESIAIALLVLTVAHLSTSASAMGKADPTGIWLATFALVAILAQLVLGVTLIGPRPGGRALLLSHRVTFGLIAVLTVLHVVLDRP